MPVQVNVVTLALYPAGSTLSFGETFEWANPTSNPVTISCCQSFCTQATYIVPAATGPNSPGTVSVTLRSAPSFYFGDSAWTAPSTPHIIVSGGVDPEEAEKEVA